MKADYENAISTGGSKGTLSLIRSKKLINHIHEYIKDELVAKGVNPKKIYPRQSATRPELTMIGFLKKKSQDVSILSDDPSQELIDEGVLVGKTDKIGKVVLNSSISINVRSQLSSISKNFDTLYERTFAEPLNLHLRVPKLVMGEVYLIPEVAYDTAAIKKRKVAFKESLPPQYIPAFQKINNRPSAVGDEYKYERASLLIVDFRDDPPRIINDVTDLVTDGIITEVPKGVTLKGLTIDDFVEDILKVYQKRHGNMTALI